MKKSLFYCLFAVLCAVNLFSSCSNEEGTTAPDLSDVIDKELVGNYGGNLNIKIDGTQVGAMPQEISVKKAGISSISLSIANFAFGAMAFGDINLENCPLEMKDGGYIFTHEEPLVLNLDGFTATVNLKNGSIVNEQLILALDIAAKLGNQEQHVEVTYEGKRGTEIESGKSKEAQILSFKFDTDYELHPMHKILVDTEAIIDETTKVITFRVNKEELAKEENAGALTQLFPEIVLSEGATISKTENFDFSAPIELVVTAEDGQTTAKYIVTAVEYLVPTTLKITFNEWKEMAGSNPLAGSQKWMVPVEEEWSSANEGLAVLMNLYTDYKEGFTMLPTSGKDGGPNSAVRLFTAYTPNMLSPEITPGFLYTGQFVFDFSQASEPLKMTHLGIDFKGKPKTLKVTYKYAKGGEFIGDQDKTKTDHGLIVAILFESTEELPYLDGGNFKNEEYHVMSAWVGGKSGISDTNGQWKTEEISFDDLKGYDATKTYKLAIACQPSIDGGEVKGAIGSELLIDDIEVVAE